jgi:hypothetical protein
LFKRILPALLVFILISLSFVGGYLYWSLYKESKPPEVKTGAEVQRVINPVGAPINKQYYTSSDGFAYEMEVTLVDNLYKKDVLLYGEVIIKGDPLERKIPIYIGGPGGQVYLGKYKDTLGGDATWTLVPSDQVAVYVKAGEPTIIKPEFFLPGDKTDKFIRSDEAVLDALIKEFELQKFELELPTGFTLVSDRIGVIR